MSEILHTTTTTIGEWGNSLGIRIKKMYAELAEIAEKDTEVTQAVIQGQHGIFIGIWLPEDQPDLDEIPEEKLNKLLDNHKEKQ